MEKAFVYESVWENGAAIEGGVSVRLFTTKEKAIEAMKADVPEIKETFTCETRYDESDLTITESDTRIEIEAYDYDDCWTGSVYEQEIE